MGHVVLNKTDGISTKLNCYHAIKAIRDKQQNRKGVLEIVIFTETSVTLGDSVNLGCNTYS